MNKCRSWIMAGVVLAMGIVASAADPRIEQHIRDLSSDDWRVRQAAEESLVSYGDQAEEPLKQLIETTDDVEAKSRAQGALDQIAENRISGPSLITMDFDGAAPQEVFAELSRQARAPLPTMPEDLWSQRKWPGVTIKVEREPFWSVMRKLCGQLGVGIAMSGSRGSLTIMSGGNIDLAHGPAVITGPFIVVAQQVSQNRTIRFTQPQQTSDHMSLQLMVLAEPKLELAGRSGSIAVLAAENEDGASLVHPGNGMHSVMSDSRHSWPMVAQLMRVPNSEKLVLFKGQSKVQLAIKKETIEIEDIVGARNISRSVGGRELVVESAEMTGEQFVIKLIMRGDREATGSHAMLRQVRILDAAGNEWANSGSNSTSQNGELRAELRFSNRGGMGAVRRWGGEGAGPPTKLAWEVVTETKEVELEFEFRDLPLP